MKERKQEKEKERKKKGREKERKKERKIPANCRVDQLLVFNKLGNLIYCSNYHISVYFSAFHDFLLFELF